MLGPLHRARAVRGEGRGDQGQPQGAHAAHAPIKPVLKAPGPNRLTLTYDELLSTFAFKYNLRHYTQVRTLLMHPDKCGIGNASEAGAYTRPRFGSNLSRYCH